MASIDEAGKYQFQRELGRGAFGSVCLAVNTATGEQVAIKKLERAHLSVSGACGARRCAGWAGQGAIGWRAAVQQQREVGAGDRMRQQFACHGKGGWHLVCVQLISP
jgi:serine/threonine protein kinase